MERILCHAQLVKVNLKIKIAGHKDFDYFPAGINWPCLLLFQKGPISFGKVADH